MIFKLESQEVAARADATAINVHSKPGWPQKAKYTLKETLQGPLQEIQIFVKVWTYDPMIPWSITEMCLMVFKNGAI